VQHKPGNEQGHDAVPEFHAEMHPRGDAPPEHTFEPDPVSEFPRQDLISGGDTPEYAKPPELPGASSKDLYTGLGLPLQGLEGRDVNPQLPGKKSNDGRSHPRQRKKEKKGLVGVGVEPKKDPVRSRGLDLPEGVERGSRGKHTADWPGAEERVPEIAQDLVEREAT